MKQTKAANGTNERQGHKKRQGAQKKAGRTKKGRAHNGAPPMETMKK